MNLLIVDDHPTNLKLLRTQLEAEGHTILEALDGVEALALLEHQPVDAVITDILMPRMDGYRLCHEIRKHHRLHDLPIIAYTATYTSVSDAKLALDMGADKYLEKLAPVASLVAALHEVTSVKPEARPRPKVSPPEAELMKEYSEALVNKLEQKNAELSASEAQYRRLFEAAKDGILILNAETGMIEDVNPFLTALLGFTREQVLRKKVWELGCFQDLIANHEKFLELQRNEYVRYEDLPLKAADGRQVAVEFVSNVYEVNGAKVIQCNARDITKRKEAEAVLKERVVELERFHRLSVGRELRMVDLKKEVNALATLAGRTPPYELAFLGGKMGHQTQP